MLPTSKYLLVAFAAMTAAGFAGCGNTTYEIHPDPSSIGGTSAAQDSSEVVPAADNNDETLAKIKELEANIDELNRKLAADGNPSPSEMPQSDPETDAGGTIDNSAPKPPVEGSTQLDATDTVAYA
ncbi:MAG TPA: hypothetical protein VLJ37_10075, partial [bacterium]|nr:hypothetical protein [bacterium]